MLFATELLSSMNLTYSWMIQKILFYHIDVRARIKRNLRSGKDNLFILPVLLKDGRNINDQI